MGWSISRTGRWNNSKLLEPFVRLEEMAGTRFRREGTVVRGAIDVAGWTGWSGDLGIRLAKASET